MNEISNKAKLITYEGIEGAGKSTQMRAVVEFFQSQNINVLLTREPGGTKIAEKIRSILIHPEEELLHPRAELYLMQAARVQHVECVLKPAKKSYDLILCDRYIDSSTAYQGIGRNLSIDWVEKLNTFSVDGMMPDLTFLIDIPVELSIARMQKRKKTKVDRFETEKLAFYTAIRQAFLDIASKNPSRFVVLDGSLPKDQLIDIQIQKIKELASL